MENMITKKKYVPAPSPMQAITTSSRQFSAVITMPSKSSHDEPWPTVRITFPANARYKRQPKLWVEEESGRNTEIKLNNPTEYGVDISAPAGRTILLGWGC